LLAAQEEFLVARKAAAAFANPELVRAQVSAGQRRLQVLGMTDTQISELIKRGKAFPSQPIQSPRDGILIEVRVQPGQYVAAGTPLFTVGLADRIWVETWMLATEVARFPEGTEASVRVEGVTGEEIRGRLEHVRQGTTLSGSVTLAHIGIPNLDNRILPGMQAWVTFRQGGKHVLSVPQSALLRSSTSTMVWVQVAENIFAPRMVKTGVESLDAVEILEGIRAGDEIVVEGAYLLNSEWTIRQGAGKIHAGH
jgi:Cu(I)/Ag(I) efflux system membrane fusion protein